MSIEAMRIKIAIASELQEQSTAVFAYRTKHFVTLTVEERLKLKEASRTLDARADEVLEDALEEGTEGAEELLQVLREHTERLKGAIASLQDVVSVLKAAGTVSKVAAGVISGGITSALPLLT
jgi:DNA-directed RNA polymerase subunit L